MKRTYFHRKGLLLTSLLVQCLAGPSYAGNLPVDELVVTANRNLTSSSALPSITHIISSLDIAEQQFRSLPQALRETAGVMVQETAFGQGSPFLRGFTGYRNLFLIDGVRLNNSVFRDGPNQYWATVDLYGLERIEVVMGPGSALYGSDAIGGTVNALTGDPFNGESRAVIRAASAERSVSGRFEFGGRLSERSALHIGVTGRTFGDLEGGSEVGRQPATGFDEYAMDLKASRLLDSGWRLDGYYQSMRQNNVPRTHRTIDAVSWHGTAVGSDLKRELDQQRRLGYLRASSSELQGVIDAATLTLSYSSSREIRDRIRRSGSRDKQGFDIRTLGLLSEFHSESPVGDLTYGIEFYHDAVDSFSTRNPVQGPVADDASYASLDVFLQDQLVLGEQLDLTLGIRHTLVEADAKSVLHPLSGARIRIQDDWRATVGSVGVVYRLLPGRVAVFASASQGFRAPNLSDLTRFDSARSNEFETPAPGLSEEKYLSLELGLRFQGDRFSADLSTFRTEIADQVQRYPTGRALDGEAEVTKANIGDGFVKGVELTADLMLNEALSLFARGAWQDGSVTNYPTAEQISVREPLDRLMPLTGIFGLRLTPESGRFWLETSVVMAASQNKLSSRDVADDTRIPPGGTPGYGVLHLRGGYSVTPKTRLTLAVENIGDHDYRVHGSGTNMPGRNILLGIDARF